MPEPDWIGNPADVEDAKTRPYDRLVPVKYDSETDTVEVQGATVTKAGGSPLGGGSSAQVFEVTDLLIPAGTDWSSGEGHQLGSFTPSSWGELIHFKLFLEADDPSAIARLILDASDSPDWETSSTFSSTHVGSDPGIRWNYTSSSFDTSDFLLGSQTTPGTQGTGSVNGSVATPTVPTVHVGLHTNGATASNITVVRARAAFLVI